MQPFTTRDAAQFDEWMVLENRALKMALAGDEQLTSGMRGTAELDYKFTILKWALRFLSASLCISLSLSLCVCVTSKMRYGCL